MLSRKHSEKYILTKCPHRSRATTGISEMSVVVFLCELDAYLCHRGHRRLTAHLTIHNTIIVLYQLNSQRYICLHASINIFYKRIVYKFNLF